MQKHRIYSAVIKADAAVVAAYGLLLPKPIFEATPLGCINVHPSLLPRWRGAAPIQAHHYAGDKETGVVIMQMNADWITGDMWLTKRFPFPMERLPGSSRYAIANGGADGGGNLRKHRKNCAYKTI